MFRKISLKTDKIKNEKFNSSRAIEKIDNNLVEIKKES